MMKKQENKNFPMFMYYPYCLIFSPQMFDWVWSEMY